ncbi:MAG: phosphoribosyl 1,2-cyclic phosphodiesterase [Caulobacter vibrioides]|uniref:Phosphoribosyl 1,2-cyclic phosphodiesterase n=1 Tax=Caulobacter vibrioides TaxID=155892 RepID=A0A258CYW7_CAUVI|nr:MAG: phosphoribosyl 1,2-cyclic phosphodiesterase [Caulobacter vibrioides]
MSGALEFTILGSGSSGGVPRADGNWGDCDPSDPRNHRSRCSLLVRRPSPAGALHETTVIIDTSPDLRLQTAAAGVRRMDAALFTHDHADQAHGIDDLRPFFLNQRVRIPAYMDQATHDGLTKRFTYIFVSQGGYPAICEPRLIPPLGVDFSIEGPSGGIDVQTFDVDHGEVRAVGYRIGGVAYTPDARAIPETSWSALQDLDVWIVDALRWTPHPTHAHVDLALEWIARARPRRAILTNLHIDLDYQALAARLPPNVEPAFDGMRFSVHDGR